MCGFSAVFYLNGNAPPKDIEKDLEASLGYLSHRGPDSHGIYTHPSGTVGLGHVRLSIIDLAHSQQPLTDEENKIWCIVTGEFYDFERVREELKAQGCVFRTNGDSELLIHLYKLYGLNAVLQLRGEFAFVLWDDRQKRLFAGRDRFGIKPLYFVQVGEKLLIASEMKAFIPMGWAPEWDVESVMAFGQYHDDRTVFRSVEKLRPGHYMIARKHTPLHFSPYWDQKYPNAKAVETRTIDEMITGVRERLIEAVRLRLRSDVPLGVYLSGGIDSSCLAGIANYLLKKEDPTAKVTAFTLSFPGQEARYDEGPIAKRTAEHIGADMRILQPTEAELIEAFEGCIWHSELALSDLGGAAKHLLSGLVQREGFRVVLTGEGADEIAAGYPFFLPDYLRAPDLASANLGIDLPSEAERAKLVKGLEAKSLEAEMGMTPMSYEDSKTARAMLGGISLHRHFAVATPPSSMFTSEAVSSCGTIDGALAIAEYMNGIVRQHAIDGTWHPLHVALYAENKTTLPNSLLNQLGDRNEMAHSIEGRVPFLDSELVDYVNGLPPSVKLRPSKAADGTWSFSEKWILREAVKPFITDELYTRTKQMFTAPLSKAPTADAQDKEAEQGKKQPQPIIDMLTQKLTKENIQGLGFVSYPEIEKQLQQYLSGDWEAGYGGLPRCLRICLLVYSLLILKEKFGVRAWAPDADAV